MVVLNKIIEFLETFAPFELAEDYDNVGLLVGDKSKEIKKIMITLDVDEKVIEDAKKQGCDLIVSHHPLIFSSIKKVVTDDSCTKNIISLIKNDIALVSVHTNFDSTESGLCDVFLDKITKTKNRTPIDCGRAGRIADMEKKTVLSEILLNIKKEFNISSLKYVGDANKTISKIAVCNGGGADFIYSAKEMGADVYVSGDFKYHHARFAYENDIALVEVPHYNAEIIFCDYLNKMMSNEFKEKLEIVSTTENKNVWNILD